MSIAPQTRIEWVEAQLRSAILIGELAPGERLLTAQLAERFSVSPTPLREALQRLAGEGLVEFLPQRGAAVAPLSAADCAEITELRALLEPLTVRHAIGRGNEEWLTRVKRASGVLLAAWGARRHDPQASEHAYRAFYDEVASACESERLRRFARVVREQEARYRLATIESADRKALAREHRSLLKAIVAGDELLAGEAIEREVAALSAHYLDAVAPGISRKKPSGR